MNLKESLADFEKCVILTRLAYNSSRMEADSWQIDADTLASTFERILQLSPPLFWSTVVYNTSIMESFDAVLDALPRSFEVDEYRLIYGWDPLVSKVASRVYYSTLAIFLRLAVYNADNDTLSRSNYLEVIRSNGILPAKRLVLAFSFFMEHSPLMVEIARLLSSIDFRLCDELLKVCSGFEQCTSVLISNCERLMEDFYGCEGVAKLRTAKMIDNWLCCAVALCNEGVAIVDILSKAGLMQDPSEYVVRIPDLVETVARLFSTEVIIDVASTLSDYPLRRLLRLRTQLEQFATNFYHTALAKVPQDKKLDMILSVLEVDRFIFLLNEKENLMEILQGIASEQREYVEKAIETAYDSQRAKTISELGKSGILAGLGDISRLSDKVQKAVEEVSQIFPDFSLPYVHLCLRHFGYDAAKAIDALLTRDEKLPYALRLVENADLTSTVTEPPTLPIFSFQDEETIASIISRQKRVTQPESTLSDANQKDGKTFRGLISLAPVVPKPPSPPVKKEAEEKCINETMKKLQETLRHLKLRRAFGERFVDTQGTTESSERLVPMPTAKKYAGIEKFKISEADKVAIRPTYQKYCYETRGDDYMYDDEYDDEYDRKEFTVEPLNAQLSSTDSDEESSSVVSGSSSHYDVRQHEKNVDGGRDLDVRGTSGSMAGEATSGDIRPDSGVSDRPTTSGGMSSRSSYTGGRQRQIKERHKNAFKQRGADRKMRGMLH